MIKVKYAEEERLVYLNPDSYKVGPYFFRADLEALPTLKVGSVVLCRTLGNSFLIPGYVTKILERDLTQEDLNSLPEVFNVVIEYLGEQSDPLFDNLLLKCKLADYIHVIKDACGEIVLDKAVGARNINNLIETIACPSVTAEELDLFLKRNNNEIYKNIRQHTISVIKKILSSREEDIQVEGKECNSTSPDDDFTVFKITF